jgi:hypothetical protein
VVRRKSVHRDERTRKTAKGRPNSRAGKQAHGWSTGSNLTNVSQ